MLVGAASRHRRPEKAEHQRGREIGQGRDGSQVGRAGRLAASARGLDLDEPGEAKRQPAGGVGHVEPATAGIGALQGQACVGQVGHHVAGEPDAQQHQGRRAHAPDASEHGGRQGEHDEQVSGRVGDGHEPGHGIAADRRGHRADHQPPHAGQGGRAHDGQVEQARAVGPLAFAWQRQQPQDHERVEGQVSEVGDGRRGHDAALDDLDDEPGEVRQGIGHEGGGEETPGAGHARMTSAPRGSQRDDHDEGAEGKVDGIGDGDLEVFAAPAQDQPRGVDDGIRDETQRQQAIDPGRAVDGATAVIADPRLELQRSPCSGGADARRHPSPCC